MTRKDYKALANAILRTKKSFSLRPDDEYKLGAMEALFVLQKKIENILALDNPNFNAEKFRNASSLKQTTL